MTEIIRASFLTVMPVPYMQDLFAAMRADGRAELSVLYMEMAAPDTYWGERSLPQGERILPGRWFNFLGGRIHYNPTVTSALSEDDADIVVVSGYSSLTAHVAMQWLSKHKKPWVFFGERPEMRRRGRFGSMLRRYAMSPALRSADAFAVVGTDAVNAYRRLAPKCGLVRSIPYFTDLAPFSGRPARPGLRSGRFRVLYCGQLIPRKGVDLLVQAFVRLAQDFKDAELVLVGEGPLKETLAERVPKPLRSRIFFQGFRPVEALPEEFSTADLFVLPSRHDGWGVVVNQALAAGLPVVASDAVGAARDLVADGGNGTLVPAGDATALEAALRRYASDLALLRAHSAEATKSAAEVSLSSGVDQWISLLRETLDACRVQNESRTKGPSSRMVRS